MAQKWSSAAASSTVSSILNSLHYFKLLNQFTAFGLRPTLQRTHFILLKHSEQNPFRTNLRKQREYAIHKSESVRWRILSNSNVLPFCVTNFHFWSCCFKWVPTKRVQPMSHQNHTFHDLSTTPNIHCPARIAVLSMLTSCQLNHTWYHPRTTKQ